jgi:hypothetical protein
MAGKASPRHPSISRLTSQLDPIPSVARRLRRAKFQPHHGRHLRRIIIALILKLLVNFCADVMCEMEFS